MKFIRPTDGCMLTDAAGNTIKNIYGLKELETELLIEHEPNRCVMVNGKKAHETCKGQYKTTIILSGYRNTIEAADPENGDCAKIAVYYLKNAANKYRLSLDDNIWFLQDIAHKKYNSLFENPYLSFFKDVNKQYGTKVHINIYYECPEFGGFNLSQMPDSYKNEWENNADWLRLSFHADKNKPDKPYIEAGYERVKSDYDKTVNEIKRFAGDAVLGPVTTCHWGEMTKYGVRAFRTAGIRAVLSSFPIPGTSKTIGNYHLTDEQVEALIWYGFYKDHEEDMVFRAGDIVLNSHTPEEITAILNKIPEQYPNRSYVDLLIHEQYFYPHYSIYLPDYKERVLTGVKWCVDRGFESAFISEVALEGN